MLNNKFTITVASKEENIKLVTDSIISFVLPLKPTKDEIGNIETAIYETVMNCITHAYKGKSGKVDITCEIYDGNEIKITVHDIGCGFENNLEESQAAVSTPIGNFNGLGFSVVCCMMDDVEIHSVIGKGTTITMTRKLGSPEKQTIAKNEKEIRDIREIEAAYECLETYVVDNLKQNYSYKETVPENLLQQVKKELAFIKETKTASVFHYASCLIRYSIAKGIFDYDNIYDKVSIKVNVDTKRVTSLMGITDVYALPLHYHCWKCGFSDFENVANATTGKELPERLCPNCECELDRWGSIPTPQKRIEITDVMNDAIIEMTFPIAKRPEVLDLANSLVGKENRNHTGVKLYFK